MMFPATRNRSMVTLSVSGAFSFDYLIADSTSHYITPGNPCNWQCVFLQNSLSLSVTSVRRYISIIRCSYNLKSTLHEFYCAWLKPRPSLIIPSLVMLAFASCHCYLWISLLGRDLLLQTFLQLALAFSLRFLSMRFLVSNENLLDLWLFIL